jgi:hypothetical protein
MIVSARRYAYGITKAASRPSVPLRPSAVISKRLHFRHLSDVNAAAQEVGMSHVDAVAATVEIDTPIRPGINETIAKIKSAATIEEVLLVPAPRNAFVLRASTARIDELLLENPAILSKICCAFLLFIFLPSRPLTLLSDKRE